MEETNLSFPLAFLTVFPGLYLTEVFWTSGSSPGCKWIVAPTCVALSLFLHSPSASSLRTCFLKARLQCTYSLPILLASHSPLIMFPSHHYVPSHFVSISTPPKESASSREAIACEQQAALYAYCHFMILPPVTYKPSIKNV